MDGYAWRADTPPRQAPLPPRPARDTRLDIVRGWLQLTICLSHSDGTFASIWLIHGAWGQSDSSEQFVFLSGLVLGSVFALKQRRAGWGVAARDMVRRAARLWRTNLACAVLFGALVLLVDRVLPGEVAHNGWSYLLADPVKAVFGLLTLSYQPVFFDVLSVFILSMLALPAFAWAVERVGAWALLPSATLWAAVQFGWLAAPDISGVRPPAFDVFAWQAIFMLGAWLGRRQLLLGRPLPYGHVLLPAAVAVVLAGFVLRLSGYGLLPLHLPQLGIGLPAKTALVPVRALHALCLAYLVARLVPAEAGWMHTAPMRALACIGRNSLPVFCLGLFLSYGATLALRLMPASQPWLDPVVSVADVAVLVLYARWLERGARPALAPATPPST